MIWSRIQAAIAPYVAVLIVCGVLAACAASSVAAWSWRGAICEREVLRKEDEFKSAVILQQRADKAAQSAEISRIQGVNDARIKELKELAAAATDRPPTVIRVCNKPRVPAIGADSGTGPGNEPGTGTGALPPSNGEGAVTYFDTAPLYAIADEADKVSADLRACQTAWPR